MRVRDRKKSDVKDVAVAAGVSVATVSRALQRPEMVAADTRRRVHDAIRCLGYTPNAQARTLRTAKTKIVIALVPDIANPFFSEVIRGIEQVAHESGYSVLLGETQNSGTREQTYADLIAARQADGFITMVPHIPTIRLDGRIPIVNACECVKGRTITTVEVDNFKAAAIAVEHLLTLGHRRIAYVSGPPASPLNIDRRRGYSASLRDASAAGGERLIVAGDFSVESGQAAMEQLIARREKFSAVFCANDEMAIGAIRALKTHGRRVPEDVSVVGFDDIRFARYIDPPLTTIAQPKNALGREAMTLLIEILQDADAPTRKKLLPADLVVRASTAKPGR